MKYDLWVVDSKTGTASRVYYNLGKKSSARVWKRWSREHEQGRIDVVLVLWPNRRPVPKTLAFATR